MSRIGMEPIKIPEGVSVDINKSTIKVSGKNGDLEYKYRREVEVAEKDGLVEVTKKIETKNSNAFWGLTRSIINNMVIGVSTGFEKKLELVGVGYRVKPIDAKHITMTLGFSHPVNFEAPDGVELFVEGNKEIIVKGADKQLVGLTAARIRKIRKPEPYKGKGIKYFDEIVRKKPGKAGKNLNL